MSAANISDEVVGGIILATIIWTGGLLFQWLRSRNSELAALRKYERLRAKVEVLSRLTTIQLNDHSDMTLNERQQSLIRSELNSVLDELEREEQPAIRRAVRPSDLLKPLQIGPSFGTWAVLTKALFYATSFVTLSALSIFSLVLVDPSPTSASDRQGLFAGTVCIMLPFVAVTLLSYWLAKRVHRGDLVTAQIVEEQRLDSKPEFRP
jgi:hypothetical protein